MNIRIHSLSFTNFKCFRSKEFTFDGDVSTIRGRNGEGKTTIADAILFCLFGKDSVGRSDLEVFKTIDKETKKPVPHLDHSVEITMHLNDESRNFLSQVTLKRSIKEDWVKKHGGTKVVFKNNKQEFTINGDAVSPTEYKMYIDNLISEKTFRAITNPTEFVSWHWKEQRAFLMKMVGEVDPATVANSDALRALVDELTRQNEDVEAYLRHLGQKIKDVKERLAKVPIRREEQNKALPEKLDWDALESEKAALENQLKELEEKMLQLQQGNGAELKREEVRKQINTTTVAIDKLRVDAQKEACDALLQHKNKVSDYSLKFNEALNNQKAIEQVISADQRLIEAVKDRDYEAMLQALRDQWPSKKFEVNPDLRFCPTCGQPIPEDQYAEKVEEMRKKFNQAREAKVKELNEQAAKIKKDQSDAAEELKRLEQKLTDDKAQLDTIKQNINEIFAAKAKVEKEHVPTAEKILAADEKYLSLSKQLEELKLSLNTITDNDDDKQQLEELKQKKAELTKNVTDITYKLAGRQQYEKVLSLISCLDNEENALVKQLSELEQKDDVAREYQTRQNTILEERINKHFSLVQWKLFRTVNNGGDSFEEPFCECFVDGIPFHSGLNDAKKLNGGLDICDTLCRMYQVSAPIVIDNSERCLNIIPTIGQQIRLQVEDCDLNQV